MADEKVSTASDKLNKVEAVRRSLRKLGKDAMPVAIAADVLSTFGLEVTPKYASMIKGQVLKGGAAAAEEPAAAEAEMAMPPAGEEERPQVRKPQQAAKKAKAKKPQPKRPAAKAEATAPTQTAPAPSANGRGTAVEMQDILAVGALVRRVGAEHLRTLIAAFEG